MTLAPESIRPLDERMGAGDFSHAADALFGILLGFSVAILRRRDPLAWLLLLLMLSFSQIAQGETVLSTAAGWNDWMQAPAAIFPIATGRHLGCVDDAVRKYFPIARPIQPGIAYCAGRRDGRCC